MSHDYDIANALASAVRADINAVLMAIVTQNAGPEPDPTFPNMPWADTANDLFKRRNNANDGWVSLFQLSTGVPVAAGGDMLASAYDPGGVAGDAFDMDNMSEGADTKILSAAERAILSYLTVTQGVNLDQMESDIAALANGMVYKDDWDASSGAFPGSGAAQTGWFYNVSAGGTVDGVEFAAGDALIAKVDNASTATYAGNWTKKDATDAVQSVAGLIGAITASALRSALNVADGADATNTASVAAAGALMKSLGTAKGDLIGYSDSGIPARLPAGTNGYVLLADSGEVLGFKWAPLAGGGDMLSAAYDPTGVSGDAFDMDNMSEGADTKILSAAERVILSHLTVTQGVNLDQMESDIAALANGMVYKDDWDASSGSFPGSGAAQTGWFYNVSVGGTVDGVEFASGDALIAKVDNASTATYAGNWTKKDATDAVQSVAGLIGAITADALRSALNVEDGADVTDGANIASSIHAGTSKATPVDADEFGVSDSAASWGFKKISWANIKAAFLNIAHTWTAAQRSTITALTDGATITPNMNNSNDFEVTLSGNRILANPANLTAGQSGSIKITQDGTGSRTLAYGSYWNFEGGTAPTLSTAASSVDVLHYKVWSSTFIEARLAGDYS